MGYTSLCVRLPSAIFFRKDTIINAKRGDIAFDVCRYASYPSVSVTVKGDSVINGDVEVSASGSDAKQGMHLMPESGTLNGDIVLDSSAETAIDASNTNNDGKAAVNEQNSFNHEPAEGYGWKSNGDGTSKLARQYTVTFVVDGETYKTQSVFAGDMANAPETDPTKEGYTFKGWFAEDKETAFDFTTAITEDTELTAKWEPTKYSITYDLAGGTVDPENPTEYTVESDDFKLNNPTKAGYEFIGWKGTDLTGSANKDVTIAKGSTGDRAYTAVWKLNTYTISYNLDGGAVATNNPSTYTCESAAFTLKNPTKEGYTFAGWTGTDLSAATMVVTVAKGSTGDRTYTANWTPLVYNIAYTLNGGTNGANNPATYTIEDEFTLERASKNGYAFEGWYANDQFTGDKVTKIEAGSTGDKQLYAKYQHREHHRVRSH